MQEDISDRWLKIEHIFELNKKGPGVKRKHSTRAIFNRIMYVLKTGCQWSRLPECYPLYKRVHETYMRWINRVVIKALLKELRQKYRMLLGKDEEPTVAIIDSKSIQTVFNHETVGVDGHVILNAVAFK